VPFQPKGYKPVFCPTCHHAQKQSHKDAQEVNPAPDDKA
jgi:hypothetical protein